MNSPDYVPVLKCKSSDIKATTMLYPKDVQGIKPLFELPLRPNGTSLERHLNSSLDALAKNPVGMPFFFDPYGFLPEDKINGESAELHSLRRALALGATACYGLDKDSPIWARLSPLLKFSSSGFAFRIPMEMLDFSPDALWEDLIEKSSLISVPMNEVDLLFDARFISGSNIDVLRENIIDFIALTPQGINLRSIVTLGSSALPSVAAVPKDGYMEVFRREYSLWGGLQFELSDAIKIGYGDYGVVHPDLVIAGPNKNANGKIRYTEGRFIHYFRGHGLYDGSGLGFKQYPALAARVMDSSFYQQAGFSAGDKYIAECAAGLVRTGNLGTWVTNDLNHHISYVARQIRIVKPQLVKAANLFQVDNILDMS